MIRGFRLRRRSSMIRTIRSATGAATTSRKAWGRFRRGGGSVTDNITSMKIELEWDPTLEEWVICLTAYASIQQFEPAGLCDNTGDCARHSPFSKTISVL